MLSFLIQLYCELHIYSSPSFFCVHLCQAGLRTLQDLGPEMRLAMNDDLEGEGLEEEQDTEDACYKVPQII